MEVLADFCFHQIGIVFEFQREVAAVLAQDRQVESVAEGGDHHLFLDKGSQFLDHQHRLDRGEELREKPFRDGIDPDLKQRDPVHDIQLLAANHGLENLPSALSEMAYLRLEHPEMSLRELGEIADPPLSKSAVYHRIRRIEELAALARGDEEAGD